MEEGLVEGQHEAQISMVMGLLCSCRRMNELHNCPRILDQTQIQGIYPRGLLGKHLRFSTNSLNCGLQEHNLTTAASRYSFPPSGLSYSNLSELAHVLARSDSVRMAVRRGGFLGRGLESCHRHDGASDTRYECLSVNLARSAIRSIRKRWFAISGQ